MKMNGKVYISVNEETKKPKQQVAVNCWIQHYAQTLLLDPVSSVTGQCSEILQLTSRLVVISASISGSYYGAEQAPDYRED